MKTTLPLFFLCLLATTAHAADSTAPAASAINSFGVDLLRKTAKPDANALLSPYSLETGLVMTYAGADGVTRDEMAKVLHLGSDEKQTHNSFGLLQRQLKNLLQRSAQASANLKREGLTNDPITLNVANRLFAQQGAFFKAPFTDLLKTNYSAPLESVDFASNPSDAAKTINNWVEQQTRNRIQNLVPPNAITLEARLVLANAVYMKAPWETPFEASATKPLPFHVAGSAAAADVPTMSIEESFGYMKFKGFTAVSIPYKGDELQLLILLPNATNGLAELESKVINLGKCAELPRREVKLYLPKFKMELGISLQGTLEQLGMNTAFDPFKANFDRISEYDTLFISAVFHKTFLILDEEGTEAAAATAIIMGKGIPPPPPKTVEVRVDHPFMFAIQHRASGACLFLGHVVDPR